jgi:transcriptional regulator with XRE-family HTH domain
MDKKIVIKKVRHLLKAKGVQLTKLGEVLGSKGGQQSKIDRANRLIRGYQKSVSLDEIKKLAKFFHKSESYFLQPINNSLAEKKNPYTRLSLAKIEKLPMSKIDELLNDIQKQYPQILKGVKIDQLEEAVKRVILKVFYFKMDEI